MTDGLTLHQTVFALVTSLAAFVFVLELVRRRRLREEYSWLWLLTAGAMVMLVVWYRLLTDVRFSDVTSGFCAFNGDVVRFVATEWYPTDYPDADVLITLRRAGFRLREVPVRMYPRAGGSSMHAGLKPIYYVFKMLLSVALVPVRREAAAQKKGLT